MFVSCCGVAFVCVFLDWFYFDVCECVFCLCLFESLFVSVLSYVVVCVTCLLVVRLVVLFRVFSCLVLCCCVFVLVFVLVLCAYCVVVVFLLGGCLFLFA